jgi:hypothetical protein
MKHIPNAKKGNTIMDEIRENLEKQIDNIKKTMEESSNALDQLQMVLTIMAIEDRLVLID